MRAQLPHSSWLCTVALAATLLGAGVPADADGAGEMDPLLEATLQLKVQSYDHRIATRLGQRKFVVGILFKRGVSSSEGAAQEMRDAFSRASENYRIKGVKPTIVTIAYDGPGLVDTLAANGVAMLYVTRGLEGAIPEISAVAQKLKMPTASRLREHVASGVGIGIVVERRKPRIVVNLKSAVACGMELDAEMLELAEVVR